jgi:hypothetical protein
MNTSLPPAINPAVDPAIDPESGRIEPIAAPEILLLTLPRHAVTRLHRESVDYLFSRLHDLDQDLCSALYRRLRPGSAVHLQVPAGQEASVGSLLTEAGFRFYGSIVLGFASANAQGQWYTTTERLVLAGKGELQPPANPPSDYWGMRKHSNYDRACRAVVERAMGLYCPEGGVVLDPAADRYGRVALVAQASRRGAICFFPSEPARLGAAGRLRAQQSQLALGL